MRFDPIWTRNLLVWGGGGHYTTRSLDLGICQDIHLPTFVHLLKKVFNNLMNMFPGSSSRNSYEGSSPIVSTPFGRLCGGGAGSLQVQLANDSFIPGAISNRTLEHLTESTMMRSCRAIRGDGGRGGGGGAMYPPNR